MSAPNPGLFRLEGGLAPRGDQPQAIAGLLDGLAADEPFQVLLGITGSGKTFTMAKVIEHWGRPTLILAHNKTLAAQLFAEFRQLFPHNAVQYFVSYYDYYQPEAYLPATDTYIEKDSAINEEIDRLRHAATNALLSRSDVIIVASVSCIFGIGSPRFYRDLALELAVGQELDRDEVLRRLVDIQYERNDFDFYRGTFRVRGDVVEVFPSDSDRTAWRISWFGDGIERIREFDPFLNQVVQDVPSALIFPSSHYVVPEQDLRRALDDIRDELRDRLVEFNAAGKLLEAQRLELRVTSDLEMLETAGYCKGIENYSRHFDGRAPGTPPATLLDYFPKDFLLFVDESHQTLPQVRAMLKGDLSRKRNLVDFGFRLPCALDNRPLDFEEFQARVKRVVCVSATPGDWELARTQGVVIEQIVRPTGLLEPAMEVRPSEGQLDDLLEEIHKRKEAEEKVLVVTLTKRSAERLTEYYGDLGVRVRYLHSDVETLERIEILRDLRLGEFDVLVGINLLREGLDLPEVSLVAVLDADTEGFLRSDRSLFQISGRAARHLNGRVILYADRVTDAIRKVLDETDRRRRVQEDYNREHGIEPASIIKGIVDINKMIGLDRPSAEPARKTKLDPAKAEAAIVKLTRRMREAARKLQFEEAARLRDELRALEDQILGS
jgi:excinuclease ABC subunit B